MGVGRDPLLEGKGDGALPSTAPGSGPQAGSLASGQRCGVFRE